MVTIAVAARGDARATATTLATLRWDAGPLLNDARLLVVDDRPGYQHSAAIAELASTYGGVLVASDEVEGWATIAVAVDSAAPGPLVLIESGVIPRPGALTAAVARVDQDPTAVTLTPAASDGAVPVEVVVCDRGRWPKLPPFRGFGGMDAEMLRRSWQAAGSRVRIGQLGVRTVDVDRLHGQPAAAARNALLGVRWVGADRTAEATLRRRLGDGLVDAAVATLDREAASPLAAADAVYWLPHAQARAGWPAALAAFDVGGIGWLPRRLPRVEVSLTGEQRTAVTVGAIARRARLRGWSSVVVVEGQFGLAAVGAGAFDDPPGDTSASGSGEGLGWRLGPRAAVAARPADVLVLDGQPWDSLRSPLAVQLGPRALAEVADAVPARSADVAAWVAAGGAVASVLQDAGAAGRLRAGTVRPPLVTRPPLAGAWLRW
ncbi:MAG: hypothetical protein ACRC35_06020 [Angustibacter sp.]